MKNINSNKITKRLAQAVIALILLCNFSAKSQCSASFTHTNTGGGNVNFMSTSTGTTANTYYYWNFGDGNSYFAINNPAATHVYSNGFYNASLTISDSLNLCFNQATDSVPVTNGACIANPFFAMYKDTVIGPSIVWNAIPVYPMNITAASWSWGDGSSSNGLYPSHTYSAAGMYNICLSITVSCGSSSTTCSNMNIYRTVGSNQNNSIAQINVINSTPTAIKNNAQTLTETSIFPNPSTNNTWVRFTSATGSDYSVIVYDITGQTVLSESFKADAGAQQVQLKTENLKAGIYSVSIKGAGGYKNLRLIKN